jgi:hypothetical protein
MKVILITLILIPSCIFSQDLYTYSGLYHYKDSHENEYTGGATYQYYENDSQERIYSGIFVFFGNNANSIVEGRFKDNLKDGKWTYTIYDTLPSYSRPPKLKTVVTVIGNYKQGYLDSMWSYERILLGSGKIIEKSSLLFSIGIPNGMYDFFDHVKKEYESMYNISTSGSFDSKGKCIGKWVTRYFSHNIEYQETREYIDSLHFKLIEKDLSTGDITKSEMISKPLYPKNESDGSFFWSHECTENPIFDLVPRGAIFLNYPYKKDL